MNKNSHIAIVGGGVAGLEIATQLGNTLGSRKQNTITLIDKDFVHIWKPILHTIAAGTNDLYQQQVSLTAHASQHHFTYVPGEMAGLDRTQRKIKLKPITMPDGIEIAPAREVEYDVLIIAVGSHANDFNIPGVSERCFFIDSRTEADQFNQHVRMNLLRCALNRSGMTISVVGGGATGVELVAELVQLVEMTENYSNIKFQKPISINLIESGSRLLSAFPEKISIAVKELLSGLGINVMVNTNAVAAEENGLKLNDGRLIESTLMVWAAGVKAPDFLNSLDGLETQKNNMLCVKPTLQTTLDDNIFAVGDCAYVVSGGLPPTAQVAHQQAKFLIKYLPKYLKGKPLPPFHYRHLGGFVSLGKYNAYGSLGKYGLLRGLFLQGIIANWTYHYIYRNYQKSIHGIIKGYLLWLSEKINKLVHPRIRLD
ncbi:NAD(P)/FAD-dependent oxidoreductase [Legionella dresdenensis]|uniref:NAD(P)/FAD-dependent oxidoreductase n=1 Tax=Legionella dresdenensis TaxID=450200 RepID=A0ABV8CB06_9GAMM